MAANCTSFTRGEPPFAETPAPATTTSRNFSVRAAPFEVHAVDYLLKPFSAERLALNLDCLARVETDQRESRAAILADGRRLPVSRAGYQRLSALLGN